MDAKSVFGIDLGTTNSSIARFFDGKFEAISIDGSALVPSVVAYDGSQLIVGRRALNHGRIHPGDAVFSVKRKMGDSSWRASLGGVSKSPEEISSSILSYLKFKAEESSGECAEDVVITVPAYFNDSQRRSTLEAGNLAGFNVLRIVSEPTAAALVYDVVNSSKNEVSAEKWLVYDLGGGTFDVSILDVSNGMKEVMASAGNCWLGGDDFDQKIIMWLCDRIKADHGINISDDPVCMARLKHLSEQSKICLSTELSFRIHEVISCAAKQVEIDYTFTRLEFEGLVRELLESTIGKVRQAMIEAGVSNKEISRLLLVGGSTRIPLVRELLKAEFSIEPDSFVDPDLSVVLGASVQSALVAGQSFSQIVVDVCPHTLGIAARGFEDDDFGYDDMEFGSLMKNVCEVDDEPDDPVARIKKKHPKSFVPLIQRNTKIPARFFREFYTGTDNQKSVEVAVYQGESRVTHDNNFVGSFRVDIEPKPAHSPVHVGFEYDLNGVVRISVEQPDGKKGRTHVMNLSKSVQFNSGKEMLSFVDPESETIASDCDKREVPSISRPINLLIKRVEAKLTGIDAAAGRDKIEKTLEAYCAELEDGDGRKLDLLEDELYEWLGA